jgi:hypothetical protein
LQRVFTTVTLLGLLVASAAAFAITEHLKLIKSPIYGTEVSNRDGVPTKLFSPVCQCANSAARLTIRLRHHDHVTVTIVDAEDRQVATIASDESVGARAPQHFPWDGRMADGTRAPDGVYHPWVHLSHARWTGRFTNNITLDTTPPKVLSARVGKPILFAGPGRTVAIPYSFSGPAHAVVHLGRRRIIVGRKVEPQDKVKWAGTVKGKPLPPGTYVLSVGAQDIAGNETPATARKTVTVTVSYIQLAPEQIRARSGRRFTVHVETAARRYTWRLGHRHGARHGKVLRLRAPTTPGTYRLVVAEHGHTTTAVVRVRAK